MFVIIDENANTDNCFNKSWDELTQLQKNAAEVFEYNEETWNIGYYNDYTSTIEIYLLDRQDQKRYGLKVYEAYPKTITGTDLNQGTNNEIIKISYFFLSVLLIYMMFWFTITHSTWVQDHSDLIFLTGLPT